MSYGGVCASISPRIAWKKKHERKKAMGGREKTQKQNKTIFRVNEICVHNVFPNRAQMKSHSTEPERWRERERWGERERRDIAI